MQAAAILEEQVVAPAPVVGAASPYRPAWTIVVGTTPIAAAVLAATGMRPDLSFAPLLLVVGLLAVAHVYYAHDRRDARLAAVTGVTATMVAAALIAGVISHAGMRLRRPLIDNALAAADRLLLIDTPGIALTLGTTPVLGRVLQLAYSSTFPATIMTALALAMAGRERRAIELATAFSACLVASAAVHLFYPALGSMVHADIARTAGLPPGAGDYHLAAVGFFRDGHDAAFGLDRISGVVTFPSFHLAMALVTTWALRGSRQAIPAWAWSGAVALSTIAIGGHYVIDLVGGAASWAMVTRWQRMRIPR